MNILYSIDRELNRTFPYIDKRIGTAYNNNRQHKAKEKKKVGSAMMESFVTRFIPALCVRRRRKNKVVRIENTRERK